MKIESKSILAKLLATENISVQQQNIPTAAFDPTNRVLYIPNWKDMSISLQDLLIGHEVGHAFETPAEGWHDAICEDKTLKPFLNIVEDARIERKIKSRYPGLVRSFYSAYRELFERDFFGVKDLDTNALPLIDRINLHFKVGTHLNLQFSDSEQSFVDRCANTETWEDVEALARELHGKASEEVQTDIDNLMDQFASDDDDDSDVDMSSDMDMDGEEADDADAEGEGTAPGQGLDSDEEEQDAFDELFGDDEEDQLPTPIREFVDTNEPGSITDKVFREMESSLVDTAEQKKKLYVNIPKVDLNRVITPAKDVYKLSDITLRFARNGETVEDMAKTLYKEFLAKNTKTVNQMAANFEMKRKASLYIKAKTAKTGELNDKKLWSYKTSDDLFKQITSVPDGKNHGMIMYLDMSGSMFRNMSGTIDQLINLSMFCRKVNIPFEVYGFTSTDSYYGQRPTCTQDKVIGDLSIQDAKVVHLLSSSFNKRQNEEAYKYLLVWKQSFYNRLNREGCSIEMNNPAMDMIATPLNATIVIGIEIAKKFREAHKVEILNTIYLTDGGATDYVESFQEAKWRDEGELGPTKPAYQEAPVFTYGSASYPLVGGYVFKNVAVTVTMLEIYKEITGSKVINFHLLDRWTPSELSNCDDYAKAGNQNFCYDGWDKLIKSQKSSGVIEVKDFKGFDVRYLVKGGKSLNLQDSDLEVKSNTRGDLLKGFRKFASNKSQSRVFVQKFIPQVA
tara:strand:- start:1824 stop:4031 length:2208 start_codon:yes stop_codon:yes gene_type:complete